MEKNNSRLQDSLIPKFSANDSPECIIMTAPSDVGVRRNLGRNGARYAPKAILSTFKKMNDHLSIDSFKISQVSSHQEEIVNYESAIENSASLIHSELKCTSKSFIHLGGGHDHALPLLKALDKVECKNILIVNFDAHCDTRVDTRQHSGTPFRDFDKVSNKPFHLVQIGIHHFANSKSTMSPLKNNSEKIIFTKDLNKLDEMESFVSSVFEECPFEINEDTALFISLDCDAISSSVMSAVSAVNHDGLNPSKLISWIETLKDFPSAIKVFGIYEYNPIFEDLSQKGARYLSGLIYRYLS